MKQPDIAPLMEPGCEVWNEPEILTAEGNLYRPDRILLNKGKVTLIDFKTGKHRNEHFDQVIKYAELLKEMKYEIGGAFLLYLNRQPEVLKVVI
jgi:hypothetical protein